MTDPTAHAAKLRRPCHGKTARYGMPHSDCEKEALPGKYFCEEHENTRPQPPPAEGAPTPPSDMVDVLSRLTNLIENERVRAYNEGYDAGHAARPKVEDAEVTQFIESLRYDYDPWKLDAADRLQRLVAELAIMTGRANDNLDRAIAAEQKLADAARQQQKS